MGKEMTGYHIAVALIQLYLGLCLCFIGRPSIIVKVMDFSHNSRDQHSMSHSRGKNGDRPSDEREGRT